jgi:hypothetical protein
MTGVRDELLGGGTAISVSLDCGGQITPPERASLSLSSFESPLVGGCDPAPGAHGTFGRAGAAAGGVADCGNATPVAAIKAAVTAVSSRYVRAISPPPDCTLGKNASAGAHVPALGCRGAACQGINPTSPGGSFFATQTIRGSWITDVHMACPCSAWLELAFLLFFQPAIGDPDSGVRIT